MNVLNRVTTDIVWEGRAGAKMASKDPFSKLPNEVTRHGPDVRRPSLKVLILEPDISQLRSCLCSLYAKMFRN